ncbi:MAG: barstar family protein [Candidatus Methylophosphatis roskildensis]
MSKVNLETVLGNAEQAGPHELPLGSLDELRAAARTLGFPLAHIDLAQARDKDDLLAALAIALKLPEWFGHNWDALIDCLCDLSWKPAPGYLILIEGHDPLRATHPGDFDTLIEIFAETSNYWRKEDIPFWALLTPPAGGKPFLPSIEA